MKAERTEIADQITKLSNELLICIELVESGKMHLATASAMLIEDESKKLTRMMWRG